MALSLFVLTWVLVGGAMYVYFVRAYNRGDVDVPPEIEALLTQPFGWAALLLVILLIGPALIAFMKVSRVKPEWKDG